MELLFIAKLLGTVYFACKKQFVKLLVAFSVNFTLLGYHAVIPFLIVGEENYIWKDFDPNKSVMSTNKPLYYVIIGLLVLQVYQSKRELTRFHKYSLILLNLCTITAIAQYIYVICTKEPSAALNMWAMYKIDILDRKQFLQWLLVSLDLHCTVLAEQALCLLVILFQ
ncbi:Hypothetical_protein [Hexamita inflata]|uniref:Hypothetical_protein n=1 Tax=Hexamita inflata TaxID=28002 RepID=A0AA86PN65_9EUKA|nr:Hypothetical protein HINF_LOCUS27953 [Hexamita inflata]